jgi:hypothetical protein
LSESKLKELPDLCMVAEFRRMMDVLHVTSTPAELDPKGDYPKSAISYDLLRAVYVSKFAQDRGMEKALMFYCKLHGKPPSRYYVDHFLWKRGRDVWRKGNRSFRSAFKTLKTLGLVEDG